MPNAPTAAPAYRESLPHNPTLKDVVNKTVQDEVGSGRVSIESVLRRVEEQKEQVPPKLAKQLQLYREKIGNVAKNVDVQKKSEGIAGEYGKPGDITIAPDLLELNNDTDQAIDDAAANTELVANHEQQHEKNGDHLDLKVATPSEAEPAETSESGSDPVVLKLGNVTFDQAELQEGINVNQTGERASGGFEVSSDYKGYAAKVRKAVAASKGVTIEQLQAALKRRDLTEVDDRTREKQAA